MHKDLLRDMFSDRVSDTITELSIIDGSSYILQRLSKEQIDFAHHQTVQKDLEMTKKLFSKDKGFSPPVQVKVHFVKQLSLCSLMSTEVGALVPTELAVVLPTPPE